MTRVKSASVKRVFHKRLLLKTSGFIGRRNNVFSIAIRALIKSEVYSKLMRRKRSAQFRRFNICFISKFLYFYGIKYSVFIFFLKKNFININRNILNLLINSVNYVFVLEFLIEKFLKNNRIFL